jgi:hypothetical protein
VCSKNHDDDTEILYTAEFTVNSDFEGLHRLSTSNRAALRT